MVGFYKVFVNKNYLFKLEIKKIEWNINLKYIFLDCRVLEIVIIGVVVFYYQNFMF